jgi:hypothetical protein
METADVFFLFALFPPEGTWVDIPQAEVNLFCRWHSADLWKYFFHSFIP